MKFIVDAQLPRTLVVFLRDNGFDAIHTKDLPDGNNTTDAQINRSQANQTETGGVAA